MAVPSPSRSQVSPVPGFTFTTCASGIKAGGKTDLLLVSMAPETTVAGMFTQNRVVAAPVTLCRQKLTGGHAQALVVNSGNANVANGQQGMESALAVCHAVALALNIPEERVFIASTGVIGERFPVERPLLVIDSMAKELHNTQWLEAAKAIMTTDTFPKATSRLVEIAGQPLHLTGIAKGAGMIHPNMATMLSFLFTDALISPALLQESLDHAVRQSFNRAIVDGDTSTNDTVLIFASGRGPQLLPDREETHRFSQALDSLCQELAQAIVRDGEGATKFVTICVQGAKQHQDALQIAATVAKSPLVKTAFAGSDPNWGRILAAVGYSGVEMDVEKIDIFLNHTQIVQRGVRAPNYEESQGQSVMAQKEITVRIVLGEGQAEETVWTCDLTHEYIQINADYRT